MSDTSPGGFDGAAVEATVEAGCSGRSRRDPAQLRRRPGGRRRYR
ncbi:hypothetical protein [Mycobacterium riyadhense]|nr:hypothetical protein [Mycobacterium riyadhense]